MEQAFSRTELLLGSSALERLAASRVAVFGIGGVGGYVCEALARTGVGHLDLIDSDTVAVSNINRQIIATTKTVGQYKTDAMEARILDINPAAKITKHNCFFLPETAADFPFNQYDYVVDAGKKLVIFARFRPEIDIIGQMLKKKKLRYGEIYGDVKLEDRGDIVKDFQTSPETMVFLAQIDTAGLGITLTAADTCVYYSVNFNYAAYSQSLARIHRIGQKNACTYIHLIAEGTIDEVVLKALAKKEDLAKTVVDTWRDYF